MFKWAAHDDFVSPDFVDRCVRALEEQPNAVLAFTNTTIVDEGGEVERHYDAAPFPNGSASQMLRRLLLTDDPFFTHCFPIPGLIRRDALQRTSLHGGSRAPDKIVLVELALQGGWALVPDRLFFRRMHPGTSIRANETPLDLARWLDTRTGAGFPMPRTTIMRSYVRAVHKASLSRSEKARCYSTIVSWLRKDGEWRVIAGEIRIAGRERFGASRASAEPLVGCQTFSGRGPSTLSPACG